ncbi:hypothetical protein N7474_003523 [Penicillium riverlandense]|uniref:uncharacterized protein n=1 Tax=Penicillium riverlandense TaxID=1903569 RepID=UPI0025485B32|nr:uncharacterized protein N7474_003523 [Penicillium riverlandense]KAJ5826385.1 hypothetical protein N7474_003523 [Penicillium riverlandense]
MASTAQAAFVEDFDEENHAPLPDTRQVANTAAKISRLEPRAPAELLVDGGSDSGYSSRTAATANSTQSGPLGEKGPPIPLKVDTASQRVDLGRKSSTRKDRLKDTARPSRSSHDEKAHAGAYPLSTHQPAPAPRSSSKSRRRDSIMVQHYHDSCYECANGRYHSSTPVEPPATEYPFYIPQRPPGADYMPPSPHTPRYPGPVIQDINVTQTSRPQGRAGRSNSYQSVYHLNQRPMSFHGALPGMSMYHQQPMNSYDQHGPPPANSAYANSPVYPESPVGSSGFYYPGPEYVTAGPPPRRDRSRSSTREQSRARRSSSLYGPPVVESEVFSPYYEEGEPADRRSSREIRGRRSSKSTYARDEDYYRMPPPPPPAPKHRGAPQIIQPKRPDPPRKSQTAGAVPSQHRQPNPFDMSDLGGVLPDHAHHRLSREGAFPVRSQSQRENRRSTSYNDPSRAARVAIESSRHPRLSQHYYDDGRTGSLEDKQREIEDYQAARSGRPAGAAAIPLSAETMLPHKGSNRVGSESGSQKSRSNSSRGSGGSKGDDDINLVVSGVKMSFTRESVDGKSINIRRGDSSFRLNIEGNRQPKGYLPGPPYSDYTGGGSRRELEDGRHSRDGRPSDRASRSSRSTYSRTRYQE